MKPIASPPGLPTHHDDAGRAQEEAAAIRADAWRARNDAELWKHEAEPQWRQATQWWSRSSLSGQRTQGPGWPTQESSARSRSSRAWHELEEETRKWLREHRQREDEKKAREEEARQQREAEEAALEERQRPSISGSATERPGLPTQPFPRIERIDRAARAASAERALRQRRNTGDSPMWPMPDRLPPYVLNFAHEITPELDVDWTRCPDDWERELRLRKVRNELLKENLQAGKPVIYRSSGWSLWPRVWPNDQCTYEPVTSADQVHKEDIVFCEVQPDDRFYAHVVSRKWLKDGEWYFTMPNMNGAVKRLVLHPAHIRPTDPM